MICSSPECQTTAGCKCGQFWPAPIYIAPRHSIMEKWVHIGRVNHGERWQHFKKLGADSADGTGIARYSHMREAIADDRQAVLV